MNERVNPFNKEKIINAIFAPLALRRFVIPLIITTKINSKITIPMKRIIFEARKTIKGVDIVIYAAIPESNNPKNIQKYTFWNRDLTLSMFILRDLTL